MKKGIVLFITSFLVFKCYSQLEGNIVDTLGKAIAGATIIAVENETKLTESVSSDSSGYYAFKKLKPGKYTVTTKAANYADAVNKDITIAKEFEENDSTDISGGEWLEIVLVPVKKEK
jgi:hypothetical protein